MLLLMRRVGESVRINEDVVIEIKEVKEDQVTFAVKSASELKTEALPKIELL